MGGSTRLYHSASINQTTPGVGFRDRAPGIPRSRSLFTVSIHLRSQVWDELVERDSRNLRDPQEKPGPDRDRGSKAANPGFGTGYQNSKIRDPGLGPGPRFLGREIPRLNYSGLSRGLKKIWDSVPELKILRNAVPVPCRPLDYTNTTTPSSISN